MDACFTHHRESKPDDFDVRKVHVVKFSHLSGYF